MKKSNALLGVLSFLLVAGCAADTSNLGSTTQTIVGGTPTTEFPAVAAIRARQPGSDRGSLCTASLISPELLLTAAHCVDPSLVGAGVEFSLARGGDISAPESVVAIDAVAFHPNFNANAPASGFDIAVARLAEPITDVAPLAINRDPAALAAGQPTTIIGYGLSDGFAQTGAGTKRLANTPINGFDRNFVRIGNSNPNICQGDSGGPVLVDIGGEPTIVGVNSFGFIFCLFESSSTRVDTYLDFIDTYLDDINAF